MNRFFSLCAFATGAIAIVSMTRAVAAGDTLTLLVMLLIATGYAAGGIELWVFQRDNQRLFGVLSQTTNQEVAPADLNAWLSQLPESMRHSVSQRLTGELSALPGLALTPYLLGLLVMLGLMGTFVGMVATLGGAVVALEGSTELSAIREGLAAPIAGLGMAFGTSVAGVAASAMLGLIATLSRRERVRAVQVLDGLRNNQFRAHSLPHQREQTYQMLQAQSAMLPQVADTLTVLGDRMATIGKQLAESDRQMAERLLQQQREFETGIRNDFQTLTQTVAQNMHTALRGVGEEVAQSLQPQLQQWLAQAGEQQTASLELQTSKLMDSHNTWITEQREQSAQVKQDTQAWQITLSQHAEDMVTALNSHQGQQLEQLTQEYAQMRDLEQAAQKSHAERTEALLRNMEEHFSALHTLEDTRRERAQAQWDALVADFASELSALQGHLGASFEELSSGVEQQLSALVTHLQESMTELVSSSAEAPKAASALIAQLKQDTEQSLARDANMLKEREVLMTELSALAVELRTSTAQQQQVMDEVLEKSGQSLVQLSQSVGAHLDQSGQELASAAYDITALSQHFAESVGMFQAANEELQAALAKVSGELIQAGERSDEQMGYYVAQAREIIDHNLQTQHNILTQLAAAFDGKVEAA